MESEDQDGGWRGKVQRKDTENRAEESSTCKGKGVAGLLEHPGPQACCRASDSQACPDSEHWAAGEGGAASPSRLQAEPHKRAVRSVIRASPWHGQDDGQDEQGSGQR